MFGSENMLPKDIQDIVDMKFEIHWAVKGGPIASTCIFLSISKETKTIMI